ncbi:MAG: flippase-like domain-containing protein [Micromonosporaceae bacterium]|nr:flippase-like domain-containing protein [Micromonosporaceae bacterium]
MRRRLHGIVTNPWFCGTLLLVSAAVSLTSLARLPDASPVPLVIGLVPFAVGKYLLCPLRWHALSVSGQGRWWHIRAYAESELLGLLSPGHTGADLWRVHRLHRTGMGRTAAVAEAALDRFIGMVGVAVAVLLAGVTLPPRILVAFLAVAAAGLGVAALVRLRRPDLFARRPLPSPRVFAQGLLLSLGYQATVAGLIFAAAAAVGHAADLLGLLAVYAASQLASLIPGINGANPRSGALAVGLTSLGASWTEALGAVALIAVLPWVPALLFGGGSLAARRIESRRSGYHSQRDAVGDCRAVA